MLTFFPNVFHPFLPPSMLAFSQYIPPQHIHQPSRTPPTWPPPASPCLLPPSPPRGCPHLPAPRPLTIGVVAPALAHGVAVSDVLPPAPPAGRQEVTWGPSWGPPRPPPPQAPTSWRTPSSGCRPCRPRHSRGPAPGSSQRRLLRTRRSGAGPGGSLLRPRTRKAVAVGGTERTG